MESGVEKIPRNIPSGGSANQYLKKQSSQDYDVAWSTILLGATILTRTEILSIASPNSGDIYYSSDTNEIFIYITDRWVFFPVPSMTELAGTNNNIGATVGTPKRYNEKYLTNLDFYNGRLVNAVVGITEQAGQNGQIRIKTVDNVYEFQIYLDGEYKTILTGFRAREGDNQRAEYLPAGTSYYVQLSNGNSSETGANGRPIIQNYQIDIGANPARRIFSGKFYDGSNFVNY